MNSFSLHLSPHTPVVLMWAASLALLALALWAYRFALPRLPVRLRGLLAGLRIAALLALVWLLAQPVFERPRGGRHPRVVVLVDRSASMSLPGSAGAPRSVAARRAVENLQRALRGRATVDVLDFGGRLAPDGGPDSLVQPEESALGAALTELARRPEAADLGAVAVVSDGVFNAGPDPEPAAAALGVPVHALLAASPPAPDRAVLEVEASPTARVGEPAPLRVHVLSDEPRGQRIGVRVMDGGREVAHGDVISPGAGVQAAVDLRVTPSAPGLALYTAIVDSLPGELTAANNVRSVALDVLPGKIGVTVLSAGLNWDLTFLRRSLAADSALALRSWARTRNGWGSLDEPDRALPGSAELRRQSVIVLDGVAPGELPPDLRQALPEALRAGAGLLLLGGEAPPGLQRFASGLERESLVPPATGAPPLSASPVPDAAERDLLAWDDDPAAGERAWRSAAPLSGALPLLLGGGDRVLVRGAGDGTPLLLARRVGRGQVLSVNGAGFWRWWMAAGDASARERSDRLWRRLVRWLAEPAQGEPLRVKPERLLTPRGERLRVVAMLQDAQLRPVSGAAVVAQVSGPNTPTRRVTFAAEAPGSYMASLENLPPGRYRVTATAARAGAELGHAQAEFAVDRWSLEEAKAQSDSTTLARIARATGGRFGRAESADRWAQEMTARGRVTAPVESVRLWEWPWTFAAVVGALGVEWGLRRRRGLP